MLWQCYLGAAWHLLKLLVKADKNTPDEDFEAVCVKLFYQHCSMSFSKYNVVRELLQCLHVLIERPKNIEHTRHISCRHHGSMKSL